MAWLPVQSINFAMINRKENIGTTSLATVINDNNYVLFLISFLYLLSQIGLFLIKGSLEIFSIKVITGIDVSILSLAALVHGVGRYGVRSMFVFFLITAGVSWGMESSSITWGFPFGYYYYSNILEPRIGSVPVIILPAYFSMGYISWVLGLILSRQFNRKISGTAVLIVPFVSAFLMTANDLCFDPVASTILGNWIWKDGGAYFGVPYTNFLGWFLTVYLIFLIFAFYLSRSKSQQPERIAGQSSWIFPVVIFFLTGVNYLFTPLVVKDNPEMHQTLSLVTLFTMIFSSVLAYINVRAEFKGKMS